MTATKRAPPRGTKRPANSARNKSKSPAKKSSRSIVAKMAKSAAKRSSSHAHDKRYALPSKQHQNQFPLDAMTSASALLPSDGAEAPPSREARICAAIIARMTERPASRCAPESALGQ